jgi:SAM-dependent methyltransferase
MIKKLLKSIVGESAQQGMLVHLDSPAGERVGTPFVKVSGFLVNDDALAIEKLRVTLGSKSVQPNALIRPDVASAFAGRNTLSFQFILPPIQGVEGVQVLRLFYEEKEVFVKEVTLKSRVFHDYFANYKAKAERISPLLKEGVSKRGDTFLGMSTVDFEKIEVTGNVSDHNYDDRALKLIEKHAQGMVLDAGAGLRSVYYSNVVNAEIVDYPTTDVLAFADALPFKDNSFDAVISLNVLEHVPNPFAAADELQRVLKPGGDLYVAVPFLQPFHGYPNHYYNMTTSGLKGLFAKGFSNIDCGVLEAGHPIHALTWMLNSYANGLNPKQKEIFTNLRVADLLSADTKAPYVKGLSDFAKEELSCVNYLTATKL